MLLKGVGSQTKQTILPRGIIHSPSLHPLRVPVKKVFASQPIGFVLYHNTARILYFDFVRRESRNGISLHVLPYLPLHPITPDIFRGKNDRVGFPFLLQGKTKRVVSFRDRRGL